MEVNSGVGGETLWENKVVLVTGGASGVGKASAQRFAASGAHVVVVDIDPAGKEVAADLEGFFLNFDISDFAAWTEALPLVVNHWGGLDLVHLNAGITTRRRGTTWDTDPVSTFTVELYERVKGVNLDGVVFGVIATLPFLEKRRGAIVVTASVSGLEEMPSDPFYSMTKHATIGFVRSAGPGLAARGISIQVLCPLGVDTPMISKDQRVPGRTFAPASQVIDALEYALKNGKSGDIWVARAPGEPYRRHEFAAARPRTS